MRDIVRVDATARFLAGISVFRPWTRSLSSRGRLSSRFSCTTIARFVFYHDHFHALLLFFFTTTEAKEGGDPGRQQPQCFCVRLESANELLRSFIVFVLFQSGSVFSVYLSESIDEILRAHLFLFVLFFGFLQLMGKIKLKLANHTSTTYMYVVFHAVLCTFTIVLTAPPPRLRRSFFGSSSCFPSQR